MVKRQKGRKLLWFDCLLTRTHSDSSASFDIVALNPFRFSSEYYDSELDLVYYNYRHYSPSLGRFLSRDPIEEQGGLNLYEDQVLIDNNCGSLVRDAFLSCCLEDPTPWWLYYPGGKYRSSI